MRLLKEFVRNFLVEKKIREAQLSGDRVTTWGSTEHVSDLQSRIAELSAWRDRQPKGSEARANYARIVQRLKGELRSALRNSESGLTEGLMLEGGAVGHLMHLYDNRDLTFGEIKSILSAASEGELEEVTEKLDGLNIVFTWNASEGDLKVARSGGDIARGGMDAEGLAAKFSGRGNLKDAFDSAFQVLRGAIGTLPPRVIKKIFGTQGDYWYSTEVIYTANPNVINYDSNSVVFHGWPVFKVTPEGVEQSDDRGGVELLSSNIKRMQKATTLRNWQVRGPAVVNMMKLSNGTILKKATRSINRAMTAAGVSDDSTIGEYLQNLTTESVSGLGLAEDVTEMVVARCLGLPGAPTLMGIKKSAGSDYGKIKSYVENFPKTELKSFIRPIELAINDFAVELLKGLESSLIGDTSTEVMRLRAEVKKAVDAIEASGDETAMSMLKSQMEKLGSIENITSPMEGVVFIYNGNAYKFTGSFSVANAILGLFKYGRGSTKLSMPKEE